MADNEMTAFGGQTLAYDAAGNLTSDASNTYTWDARNDPRRSLCARSGVLCSAPLRSA